MIFADNFVGLRSVFNHCWLANTVILFSFSIYILYVVGCTIALSLLMALPIAMVIMGE